MIGSAAGQGPPSGFMSATRRQAVEPTGTSPNSTSAGLAITSGEAVVARTDESGVSIAAFVALKPAQKRSIIAMKRHCTVYLPNYMIPDTITFMRSLPATSTDKVDYQQLKSMAATRGPVT